MAYGLILISQRRNGVNTSEWFHLESYMKNIPEAPASIRGDLSKLCYWDLLESKRGKRDDGSSRNGMYRITDKGMQFVMGQLRLKSHVRMFNNATYGFDGKDINIVDALSSKFNYGELMKGEN